MRPASGQGRGVRKAPGHCVCVGSTQSFVVVTLARASAVCVRRTTSVTLGAKEAIAMILQAALESTMLLCFGIAWPVASLRMMRTRRPEGKGLAFTLIILAGYVAGASAKWLSASPGAEMPGVFWLYTVNGASVAMNLALQWYFGRRRAGRLMQAQAKTSEALASAPADHSGLNDLPLPASPINPQRHLALLDAAAFSHPQLIQNAGGRCFDRDLHLQRFEEHEGVAEGDHVACFVLEFPDRAGDQRLDSVQCRGMFKRE